MLSVPGASVDHVVEGLSALALAPSPELADLPDELIVRVVEHLGLQADADEVLVDEAVVALALTCQQFRLALLTQCHWAVVALRQEATVERAVGPKPLNCTWRDEWVPMRMERCTLEKKSYARSTFEKGGVNSIEKVVENGNKSVQWKITNGWGVEDAGAYSALVQGCSAAIAKSINEGSPRYAASVHLMARVLTEQAVKQARSGSVAALCYYHLKGTFGLADEDPEWNALLREGAARGTSFQTKSITIAHAATDRFTGEGFLVSVNTGGTTTLIPQDSAVVRFVSAKEDAHGLHTMIHASPTPGYALPAMATITLQEVAPPGTWEAYGVTVQQTLYIVGVTFAGAPPPAAAASGASGGAYAAAGDQPAPASAPPSGRSWRHRSLLKQLSRKGAGK
jgi:hypothetical protein